jgi:Transposase DDE domain
MAEPELSSLTMLTELFSAAHLEASARRTGFVRRASKITGKLFVALVTFGQWSTAKTSLAQWAAKAAQLCKPVDVSPEAIHQRMNRRALAFLQDLIQTAFAKLHAGDTSCEEGLFTPFPRVYIADSTGFGLPDTLKDHFPGAGGSAGQAGAKIQLVWDYKSTTFAHFALIPWKIPDNKYVDTVVSLVQRGALVLFALGYFKLHAFAQIAAAQAYFLSRLNHQTLLLEARAGRWYRLDVAQGLGTESRPLLEKAIYLGAHERVAARLIAARVPEAVVNERRHRARASAKKRGYTPSQAHLTLLAWNLFITNVPGAV